MSNIDCAEVVWKIKNYSLLPKTKDVMLRTPTFKVKSLLGNWHFSIYIKKTSYDKFAFSLDDIKDYFDEESINRFVNYNCAVEGTKKISCASFSSSNSTSSRRLTVSLFSREMLQNYSHEYIFQDTLTFRFQIWITNQRPTEKNEFVFETTLPGNENACTLKSVKYYSGTVSKNKTSADCIENVRCKCTADDPISSEVECKNKTGEEFYCLHQDIGSMYRNGRFSDYTLRLHDKVIPVHSCILSARSPVFDRMLETNMREKKLNVLVLDADLDVDTVSRMLDYMYTDNPGEMDPVDGIKLYYAADKYDIRGLKEIASSVLVDNIDSKNVLIILELADKHNDPALKSAAVETILRHEVEVMTSEEMKKLTRSNPGLVAEIAIEMANLKII